MTKGAKMRFMLSAVLGLVFGGYAAGTPVVRHWAVEPMSDVMRLADTIPTDGVETGVVRIVMAKGEFKPAGAGFTMDRDKVCGDY